MFLEFTSMEDVFLVAEKCRRRLQPFGCGLVWTRIFPLLWFAKLTQDETGLDQVQRNLRLRVCLVWRHGTSRIQLFRVSTWIYHAGFTFGDILRSENSRKCRECLLYVSSSSRLRTPTFSSPAVFSLSDIMCFRTVWVLMTRTSMQNTC